MRVNFTPPDASPRLTGPVKHVIFSSYNISGFRKVMTGMLSVFCVYFPAVRPLFPGTSQIYASTSLASADTGSGTAQFQASPSAVSQGPGSEMCVNLLSRIARHRDGFVLCAVFFRAVSDLRAYFPLRDSARSDMCGIFSPAPAFLTHKTECLPPLFSQNRALSLPRALFLLRFMRFLSKFSES